MAAGGEDRSTKVQDSTPLPQTEVAEATVVDGTCTSSMVDTRHSSCSFDFMYSVVIEAQAGGSAIPEAVAMETATEEVEVAVPVAEVAKGQPPPCKLQ
jgi:hypothetical protein